MPGRAKENAPGSLTHEDTNDPAEVLEAKDLQKRNVSGKTWQSLLNVLRQQADVGKGVN